MPICNDSLCVKCFVSTLDILFNSAFGFNTIPINPFSVLFHRSVVATFVVHAVRRQLSNYAATIALPRLGRPLSGQRASGQSILTRAIIWLSYVTWAFNVGRPFWFMVGRLVTGCTTCHQSVTDSACIYRNKSYSIYIAYYCAQTC